MPLSSEELQTIIGTCRNWRLDDDNFISYKPSDGDSSEDRYCFDRNELSALDTRLPEIVVILWDESRQYAGSHENASMENIRLTLTYWVEPFPVVHNDTDEEFVISEVHRLSDINVDEGTYCMMSTTVRIKDYLRADNLESTSYVSRVIGNRILFIAADELEQKYSGFAKRLEAVKSLELTGSARFDLLFKRGSPTVSVAPTEITFD